MRTHREVFRPALAALIVGLLTMTESAIATPVTDIAEVSAPRHDHCAVVPWSYNLTAAGMPIEVDSVLNILLIVRSDQLTPPATDIGPGCKYEISDILSFFMTVTFTDVDGGDSIPFLMEDWMFREPAEFYSGVPRTGDDIPNNAHQTPGQTTFRADRTLRYGPWSFWDPDGQPFIIESIDISAHGNHYYLPIPEPAVALLIGIGGLCGWLATSFGVGRRRRMYAVGTNELPHVRRSGSA